MKSYIKKLSACFMLAVMLMSFAPLACFAEETEAAETAAAQTAVAVVQDATSAKAMAAAIAIGLAAAAGAIGMGIAIAKSVDGISRQPEAEGKIRTSLMLGLVFVETAIIYALIVAILIIFVL